MSWHQFRYIFTAEVEHAMRYSIEEAIRRVAQTAPMGGTSKEMSDEAVESFKRKMEKHTGPLTTKQREDRDR